MDYVKRPRKEWVLKHPAQLVLMISQVYWCHSVENALENEKAESTELILSAYKDQCIKQLADLSVLVRSDLHALERRILTALITIDVHARDIIEDLIRFSWTTTFPLGRQCMFDDFAFIVCCFKR